MWKPFWQRLLSPQTARFVLALLSLFAATGATFWLMSETVNVDLKEVVVFAIGQMYALAAMAFGYYFGSTARNDERPLPTHIMNPPSEPVPTTDAPPDQYAWQTFGGKNDG